MSNRYTQIQPSAYNPMSLNEIMLAPTIQRRQHDDTNARIQEYLASLSSIDPHDKHWDIAQAEKQRLTEELDRNASQLAQKGFSPDITDNIMRFNRDYQESVSPTGKLGQIHAEKKNIQAQEDLFRQNYAPTYGGDRVEEILAEEMNKYRQQPIFDDKGRITSYKPRQLSKYVNVIEEADKYFTRMGIHSKDFASIIPNMKMSEDGTYRYVATTSEERNRMDNDPNIKHVENFMNHRIVNPSGDLHQTVLDQGKTPEDVMESILAMSGIYRKTSKGDKEGEQWSNFMSTGTGDDKPKPDQGFYVNASGTFEFTKDFKELQNDAIKILEDSNSSPTDKAKARDVQKLIEDIENELTDPESIYYDEEYVKSLNTEEEILNSFSTETLRELFETTISPNSFSKSVNQVDVPNGQIRLLYQMRDPEDGKLYDKTIVVTNEEYSEIQKDFGKKSQVMKRAVKNLENKRNERLNQHGYEELRYVAPVENTAQHKTAVMNFFRGSTSNNMIPQNVNITSENIPKTVKFDDPKHQVQLSTAIRRASDSEIRSIIPTELGRDVGYVIEIDFNKTNENAKIGNHNLAGELVTVFIPINTSTEQLTGHAESSMLNLNSLPQDLQDDFKKMIDTKHISSTRNAEDLGQNAIPGRSLFGNTFEGDGEVDFLEIKGNTRDENYVVMHGKNENSDGFKPMTWESIFRYDILEDDSQNSKNYMMAIATSGIKEPLKKAAKKYKSSSPNRTLYDDFNIGSDNADWMGLIKELQKREIRLDHTRDMYEISRLKFREQYE